MDKVKGMAYCGLAYCGLACCACGENAPCPRMDVEMRAVKTRG